MKRLILSALFLLNISLLSQSDTLTFVLDDFEDLNDTTAMWSGPWEEFSDATEGSGFTKEFSDFESHNSSVGSIHITGSFASYGGVAAYFKSDKSTDRNLNFDGITFWTFSNAPSQTPVRFRIREKKAESLRGWNYFCYDFTPGSEWQKITIPFDSLKLSWSDPGAVEFSLEDVYAIDFGPNMTNTPIDVFIDDIYFYKNLEIGDWLVFDDFEDLDSNNVLWGGGWSTFKDNAASDIQGAVDESESYDNSNASVHVWGKYASYGGYVSMLNTLGTDVDLKGINGFSFYAKGDSANNVYVRLRERKAEIERDYNYFGYKFIPTTDWQYYYVPFDSLTLVYGGETNIPFTTTDIFAFDIGPASGNTNIDVYIDNITFHKNESGTVDVKEKPALTPENYALSQNYPNPFNPSTTINFSLAKNGFVSLKVYDITGREIAILVNQHMETGSYNINYNASHIPLGLYLYLLNVNGISLSNKMLLLK